MVDPVKSTVLIMLEVLVENAIQVLVENRLLLEHYFSFLTAKTNLN